MNFLGIIAAFFSLSIIFLGLPNQIYQNRQRRSVHGLSMPYWILATCAYIAWVVYGLSQVDYFILSAHLPGMFLCLMIIYQFIIYRDQDQKKE